MSKKLKILISVIFLFETTANAQVNAQYFGNRGGAEFWVGREEGKPLIVVNIVNGVNVPGIYHVPVDTTVPQLIGYAGGAVRNSDLGSIEIRRTKLKDQTEFIEVDLKKIIRKGTAMVTVADRDIINIPVSYDLEKTAQYVGIIAGLTGIILSAIAIRDSNL